ncbi:TRAP transporter substrate-binding protein [Natrinema sp. SYSU A 869]|uniref:TRAP transporter substrate-binding protein n=1 Tax=Natrinema sp. SYSU A 869 TaxID=2871694 RepID=UPI0021078EF8|nr:TRAP transporter substrate-binding protein [Natrinema sp. SYSU A 869]
MSGNQTTGGDSCLTNVTRRQAVKMGVTAAGLTSLAGCAGGDSGTTITLASVMEEGTSLVHAGKRFKERMEEESDGDITVDFSYGGSYGSEVETFDLMSEGAVDMYTGGSDAYDVHAPEYYFFNTPFVLESFEHQQKIMETDEFNEEVYPALEEAGIRVAGPRVYRGMRHFTSNKPVRAPEDVQGMDLRLPSHDAWVNAWESVGASPTPVSLDELYSGLQQGVVGASEGPPAQISSLSLWEVQDYYSLTSHLPQSGQMYVSTSFYDGLDESDQEMFDEIVSEVTEEATQWARDTEEELLTEIEENGMEIIDDVNSEAFYEAAAPAIEQLFEETYAGTWDEWQNL